MHLKRLSRHATNKLRIALAGLFTALAIAAPSSAADAVSQAVTAGAKVTLTVTAVANPAPTYQWRKDGSDIPGATGALLVLNAVTPADAGTYTAIATNEHGSAASNEAVIEVTTAPTTVPPTFATHPSNITADAGSTVSFVAAAAGTPTPTYQWFRDGAAVSGATGSTLSLTNVSATDVGSYTVVATNSAGTATSNPATLTVIASAPANIAPVFTTQPSSVVVASGSDVTFSANASGNPAPAFQWFKNGGALGGKTGSSLTLLGVTSDDLGSYTVVATNAAGSATSAAATLTLSATPPTAVAPTISTQPVSQTANTGANITFTVAASGTPAPSFQWFKNGTAITGATAAAFTLNNVSAENAGSFHVVATNSAGSATSATVTLTVTGPVATPPVFTTQPTPVTVPTGGTITLSAAASGTPSPNYQWFKNGSGVASATAATLTIANAGSADAGTYYLLAINSAGTATSTHVTVNVTAPTNSEPTPPAPQPPAPTPTQPAEPSQPAPTTPSAPAPVPVYTAPSIATHPASQTVTAGSRVTFSITATGTPAPTYQWSKNGAVLGGATSAALTLSAATAGDAGSYSVTVSNGVGSVTSNAATLTVTPAGVAPTFSVHPLGQNAASKSNVTFTASATGTPAPTYQWRKDGVAIHGATRSSLTLLNINKSNAGTYTVVATNSSGTATSSPAVLTVDKATGTGQNPPNSSSSSNATEPSPDTVGANDAAKSRLVNLSVRSYAGSGNDSLIVGFVVEGSAPKPLLVRGIGPTLTSFGVPGALDDPGLSLYSGSTSIGSNDDWSASADPEHVATTSAGVGAFSLGTSSKDAVLLTSLEAGAYTAQVSGKQARGGVALVELYDAQPGATSRLVNVSVRTNVGTDGNVPVIGFVVDGTAPKQLLVRAVGPALSTFGVSDVLADPQLEVFQGSTSLQSNDDWAGTPALNEAFAKVGAFAISDGASKDAAVLVNAAPGAYTVVVSGANRSAGVVIVEVYEVP